MATERMVKLYNEVDELVKEYNEVSAPNDDNVITADAMKRMRDIENEVDERVKEYANLAKLEGLSRFSKLDNPLFELVKELTYEVIRIKDENVEDSDIKVRTITKVDKPYDPADLVKYCKDRKITTPVGVDKAWPAMIERFNCAMTAKKAEDLGLNPKEVNDSINMSKVAAEISLGKNPCSNTQMLKTLQSIVTAMLGEEYKAVSHDVNYLKTIYAKKSRKALTVTASNVKQMRCYITEICHRLITGKHYEVEYKAKEK